MAFPTSLQRCTDRGASLMRSGIAALQTAANFYPRKGDTGNEGEEEDNRTDLVCLAKVFLFPTTRPYAILAVLTLEKFIPYIITGKMTDDTEAKHVLCSSFRP